MNFLLALKTMSTKTKEQLHDENRVLTSLKNEFDKYYPYRKYETIATYFIPFTAFLECLIDF